VRPADVTCSDIDTTLEARAPDAPRMPPGTDARYADRLGRENQPAVRLGLNRISSLSKEGAERLLKARAQAPFTSTEDLALRAELDGKDMAALAAADALMSLSGHRRQQVWDATAQRRSPALLKGVPINEPVLQLPAAPEGEEIVGLRTSAFAWAARAIMCESCPLNGSSRSSSPSTCIRARSSCARSPAARPCAPAASSRAASARAPPTAPSSSRSRTRPATST